MTINVVFVYYYYSNIRYIEKDVVIPDIYNTKTSISKIIDLKIPDD